MKSPITTHVLDTTRGLPAAGIPVTLEIHSADGVWKKSGNGTTDADGRIGNLLPDGTQLSRGTYRLTFETGSYFRSVRVETFYPLVSITFEVKDSAAHYHVPLLLSPFGYSTYRGS